LVTVLVLAALYGRFGALPGVDAALRGIGAAAGGLVLATGVKMAEPLVTRPRALAVVAVTFVMIALLRWPLVPVLLVLAPLSVLAAWWRPA
jgi:chromate transporter